MTSHTVDPMWDGCVRCGATRLDMAQRGYYECPAADNVVSEKYLEWKRHYRAVLEPIIDAVFASLKSRTGG